jgi:hypothetical protein
MGIQIFIYAQHRSISIDSDYKFGMVGNYHQLFASACNGSGATSLDGVNSTHWACRTCKAITTQRRKKIAQTIRDRSAKITVVLTAMNQKELTPPDLSAMKNFLGTPKSSLSSGGLLLLQKLKKK